MKYIVWNLSIKTGNSWYIGQEQGIEIVAINMACNGDEPVDSKCKIWLNT